MPERVKTKFEDSDSDTQDLTKKRKAAEAFGLKEANRDTTKTKPKPVIAEPKRDVTFLQKHREKNLNRSKVVNFHDQDQLSDRPTAKKGRDDNSSNASALNNQYATQGRLKQRAASLLTIRQQLPIWSHADEIREKVRKHDVLLLVGETGSGKSTQIPQFVLPLCQRRSVNNGSKVGGTIAVTQPRRVAAISLARRVAEEMGTPLGSSSPASQVGYAVRFDQSVSPSTRVKFLTDGMLLQELMRDPWLKEYSAVVVDEVHERGVNVDLVLGFLKRLIEGRSPDDGRGGIPLKVIIMSATADMESIQTFFGHDPATATTTDEMAKSASAQSVNVDAKNNKTSHGLKDNLSMPKSSNAGQDDTAKKIAVVSCYIKGRQYPVKIHYTPIPLSNVLDAALDRIIDIHTHSPLPGDVLVFLPGQETIDSLESMCQTYAQSLLAKSKEKGAPKLPKLLILPLFAALSTAAQQRVFEPTPPFTRKIILSTNIAETSVTVPGIRHVIDTGKRKARFFRPGLNLATLLAKPVSRSSANQRAGRAGREAPGNCYRLYTEKTFYELAADTEPEILRCDLSQLVLTLKARNIDNVLAFPLLTSPPLKSLERALLHLLRLKALDHRNGRITKLGKSMSTLPLPANLAKVLFASQLPQFDCLEPIIDIVSGLSVENIWLPIHNSVDGEKTDIRKNDESSTLADTDVTHDGLSGNNDSTSNGDSSNTLDSRKGDNYDEEKVEDIDDDDDDETQDPITQARSTLYRREGDHLTLLAAIQSYVKENVDRKEWCKRYGISHRAMTGAMDVRKQLRKLFLEGTRYKLDKIRKDTKGGKKNNKDDDNIKIDTNIDSISTSKDTNDRILRALLFGLSENIAHLSSSSSSSSSTTTSNRHPTNPNTTNSTINNQTQSTIWTGPYITLPSSSTTLSSSSNTNPNQETETNPNTSTTVNTTTQGKNLQIHPSSVLFSRTHQVKAKSRSGHESHTNTNPAWIMFSEFVVTNRAYARYVSGFEGVWLEENEKIDFWE